MMLGGGGRGGGPTVAFDPIPEPELAYIPARDGEEVALAKHVAHS
jgi:hypothetical protein